jgi:inosine-uridine nucleoside N-ribohydrolase
LTKVIIDTDPGTDDAMALMMALQSPDLEVMGLTTVGGNATLAHTTRNALRVLEYLDRTEVPVHAGASRPLKGGFQYAYYFHGPGGLTARMPRPSLKPRAASAVDFLLEATRSEPGEVVLIALGPLTNVAKALLEEPRLKERLREIFVMGSAVGVPGNVTPHAEFNFYNDPRAANIVLSSGVPTTLVGLDVCDQVFLEADDVGRFGDSRAESLAARMLKNWFRAQPNGDRYNLCDPLTILAAVQPDLLTYNAAEVSVKESDSEFLGKTEASFGGGRVRVAVAVDVADAMAEFRSMLASGGESSVFR